MHKLGLCILSLFILNAYGWETVVEITDSQYLLWEIELNFDFGFGTGYWGYEQRPFGIPAIAFTNTPAQTDARFSYGFLIFSVIQVKTYMRFFQFYLLEYTFNFIPAALNPFSVMVSANRPWLDGPTTSAVATKQITVSTWSDWVVGRFNTIVT